ncbi:hypothetical protein KAI56_04970 [Candidatus Parcubacteria bacterium]|nr:hypothetical protein [Candidatus Parcubacteria bacterium]
MEYHLMTDYYFMMLGLMVDFYRSLFSEGIIVAMIVLVVGFIFAVGLSKAAKKVVQELRVDKTFDALGVKSFFKKGGIKFSVADLTGWIVKWFVILFALMMAVDSLGLPRVSSFLTKILDYLPNLIGALAILTVGLIIAQAVYEAINGTAKASGIRIYSIAAVIAKWSLIIITFLVILEQIGIQTTILQVFAGSLGLMLALAGGLAFGLGGQYQAKELLEEIKNKVSKRG